jgi:hypothetical protein
MFESKLNEDSIELTELSGFNRFYVIYSQKSWQIKHAETQKSNFSGPRGDFLPLLSVLDECEQLISWSGRCASGKMASRVRCVTRPWLF